MPNYGKQGHLSYYDMPPTPLLLFRGFKPGAFSLEVCKIVITSKKEFQYSKQIRTEPRPSGCTLHIHDTTMTVYKFKEKYFPYQNMLL